MKAIILLVCLASVAIISVYAVDFRYYKIRGLKKTYVIGYESGHKTELNNPPRTKVSIELTLTLHEGTRAPVDTSKWLETIVPGRNLKYKVIEKTEQKLMMDEVERLKKEIGASEIIPISSTHK